MYFDHYCSFFQSLSYRDFYIVFDNCNNYCTEDLQSQQILFRTQQHLNTYARQGLRVLVMAKRTLPPTLFADWVRRVQEAEMTLDAHEKRIREIYNEVESNLILLGNSDLNFFVFSKIYNIFVLVYTI